MSDGVTVIYDTDCKRKDTISRLNPKKIRDTLSHDQGEFYFEENYLDEITEEIKHADNKPIISN